MRPYVARLFTILLLVACLVVVSHLVHRINADQGPWAMLFLLAALPLALALLPKMKRRDFWVMLVAFITLVAIAWVQSRGVGHSVTIDIHAPHGDIRLVDPARYADASTTPSRIPFRGVNDIWSVLSADDTPCTVTWSEGPTVRTTLAQLMPERGGPEWTFPPILITILTSCLIILSYWAYRFGKELAIRSPRTCTRESAALLALAGLIIASVISPPGTWLSNVFLSRPDDWLFFETGARSLLNGNLWLMPPPGGVELWSPLYVPVLALLHVILGPSIHPVLVVQFAIYPLLVPLGLTLLRDARSALRVAWGAVLLGFVAIDIELHYAWHLLGDMVPLFLLIALIRAFQRLASGLVLGIIGAALYLSRLEMIAAPLIVLFAARGERGWSSRDRWCMVLVPFAALAFYMARWWIQYEQWRPVPLWMADTGHLPLDRILQWQHIARSIRALLGDYSVLNEAFQTRWHWLPIHVAFLYALVRLLAARRMGRTAGLTLQLFGYVLATRLLSPAVGIYGHRHSLALIVLELAFIGLVLSDIRRGLPSPRSRATLSFGPREPHGP
ncbi:MAG: hypothetical protein IPM46_13985 [Flavobacteriales bacterium]|nr:hypothetical protein [Flavobacteriales bacterium]